MNYSQQYRLGPTRTPKPLKILLLSTLFISLFSALFNHFFPDVLHVASPKDWLALSTEGISHGYLWQFFTYLFVHPFNQGVSFGFIFSLAFNLYMIWIVGAGIIERRGSLSLFSLYFLSALFVGLILYGMFQIFHKPVSFTGNTPTLYALLIAWVILYPDAQIFLLVGHALKAKTLIVVILVLNLLIDFSSGEWMRAAAYFFGALFGYLYPILVWNTPSPFQSLKPIEKFLLRRRKETPYDARAKIYDFKTGRAILSDDEFLEAMLSKISLYGKKSLTWKERWRLRRISKRKKKQ